MFLVLFIASTELLTDMEGSSLILFVLFVKCKLRCESKNQVIVLKQLVRNQYW